MQIIPQSIATLIDEFAKLPGVGPRSAERLTFFLLRHDSGQETRLGEALQQLRANIVICKTCFNYSDSEECVICRNDSRNHHIVTVVEEPLDVIAVEKTGLYEGVYHVLGGVISPLDGVGPAQLEINSLVDRIARGGVTEVVLATNPTTEGEATGLYIRKQLENQHLTITRLARGLPVGGDLEYADQITLGRALQERQLF